MFVIERNMPEILKQTQVLLNMTKAGKNYFADINEDFDCERWFLLSEISADRYGK